MHTFLLNGMVVFDTFGPFPVKPFPGQGENVHGAAAYGWCPVRGQLTPSMCYRLWVF